MNIKKINNIIKNPGLVVSFLNKRGYLWLSDKKYLKWQFESRMGKKLNLESPETYNEKLQWLKLYDRNPKYTQLVDKYEVRNYIENTIGSQYLIPLIGIWDSVEDIEWSQLPNQFVMKCTHDSGGVIICHDKSKLDINFTKEKLNKSLSRNYYYPGREWPYKNVRPRVIAEEYIEDKNGELNDYKFYCFNGNVHSVMLCIDRSIDDPKFYFFNESWELLRINEHGKKAPDDFKVPKPKKINEMFNIARKLSEGTPHVRVDLYYVDDSIYFGEMTFYSDSGFDNNLTDEIDKKWGKLINLDVAKDNQD